MAMTYQVFLQHSGDDGYSATPLSFPDCVAVGKTREEALANLRIALGARLAQGEIVSLEVEDAEHSWLKGAGLFKDDPTYEEFLAEIEAQRQSTNEAETQGADLSP
jgi:predicted RNase H-like HicB family nuclease